MKTQPGDRIIIRITGHDPDGVINATIIDYVRGEYPETPCQAKRLRFILSKAVRQWSTEITKEQ